MKIFWWDNGHLMWLHPDGYRIQNTLNIEAELLARLIEDGWTEVSKQTAEKLGVA